MTPEEQAVHQERAADFGKVQLNASLISNAIRLGREKQMVDQLARPELLRHRGTSSGPPGKGKGVDRSDRPGREDADKPLESHVVVKINKLAEGMDKMRETFRRVQMKTEREFEYVRFRSAEAAQNASEYWQVYNQTQSMAYTVGREIKHLEYVRVHLIYVFR